MKEEEKEKIIRSIIESLERKKAYSEKSLTQIELIEFARKINDSFIVKRNENSKYLLKLEDTTFDQLCNFLEEITKDSKEKNNIATRLKDRRYWEENIEGLNLDESYIANHNKDIESLNSEIKLMITKYLIKNSKELSRKSDEIDRISQINEFISVLTGKKIANDLTIYEKLLMEDLNGTDLSQAYRVIVEKNASNLSKRIEETRKKVYEELEKKLKLTADTELYQEKITSDNENTSEAPELEDKKEPEIVELYAAAKLEKIRKELLPYIKELEGLNENSRNYLISINSHYIEVGEDNISMVEEAYGDSGLYDLFLAKKMIELLNDIENAHITDKSDTEEKMLVDEEIKEIEKFEGILDSYNKKKQPVTPATPEEAKNRLLFYIAPDAEKTSFEASLKDIPTESTEQILTMLDMLNKTEAIHKIKTVPMDKLYMVRTTDVALLIRQINPDCILILYASKNSDIGNKQFKKKVNTYSEIDFREIANAVQDGESSILYIRMKKHSEIALNAIKERGNTKWKT